MSLLDATRDGHGRGDDDIVLLVMRKRRALSHPSVSVSLSIDRANRVIHAVSDMRTLDSGSVYQYLAAYATDRMNDPVCRETRFRLIHK